jgi:hypothetical protein
MPELNLREQTIAGSNNVSIIVAVGESELSFRYRLPGSRRCDEARVPRSQPFERLANGLGCFVGHLKAPFCQPGPRSIVPHHRGTDHA